MQKLLEKDSRSDFNPRSREGSDVIYIINITQKTNFNPRSREGSDRQTNMSKTSGRNFNPRSREGSDIISPTSKDVLIISIHAPAKGATKTA